MNKRTVHMAALAAILAVALISGCMGATTGGGERSDERPGQEGSGEHGAGGEHGSGGESGGEGEEGGNSLAPDETFDMTRGGARLIMNYDAAGEVFTGTVTNTTSAALQDVRVEVHLYDLNAELGPTTPQDLAAGKSVDVSLSAVGKTFTSWTAHAEVGPQSGSGEHGPGDAATGSGRGTPVERSGGEHGAGGESGSS